MISFKSVRSRPEAPARRAGVAGPTACHLKGSRSVAKAKVARELGVRVNQLRQWRLDFEDEERNGVPKQELATAEQDLGTLRRENAKLREENEILKKAAIYFAKASR